VEGTGSYCEGLTRYLLKAGIELVEVCRPDRTGRRRRGKSDTIDGESAAMAEWAGQHTHTATSIAGKVEALPVLRAARGSAVESSHVGLSMLRYLIAGAPPNSATRSGT
jgi:transposase